MITISHLHATIMKKNTKLCFLLILTLFLPACDKNNDDDEKIVLPKVDYYINVNSAEYLDLTTVGGFVYLSNYAPSQGIIVYRKSLQEFNAFERTCTFDPYGICCRLQVDESGMLAEDTCCNSKFLLLDGSPLENSASQKPLRSYRTSFDGNILRVYN